MRLEVEKTTKDVAALEKLMGFYAKDPKGAEITRQQVTKEKEKLASLESLCFPVVCFL